MNIILGSLFSMEIVEMESSLFIKHISRLFRVDLKLFMLQGASQPSLKMDVTVKGFLTENVSFFSPAFFPVLIPLLKVLGFSIFSQDCYDFVKKIVEKLRADRDGASHQVCTEHTTFQNVHEIYCELTLQQQYKDQRQDD